MGVVLSLASSRTCQIWTASSLSASGCPLQVRCLLGVALPQTDLAFLLLPHGCPWGALFDSFLGAQGKENSDPGSHGGATRPLLEAGATGADVRGDACCPEPPSDSQSARPDGEAHSLQDCEQGNPICRYLPGGMERQVVSSQAE